MVVAWACSFAALCGDRMAGVYTPAAETMTALSLPLAVLFLSCGSRTLPLITSGGYSLAPLSTGVEVADDSLPNAFVTNL